jgi:AraC family transcriptional regulator
MNVTKTKMELEHRVVSAKPMFIAGIEKRYKFANLGEIPEQWNSFAPHIGKIKGQAGNVAYGVSNEIEGGIRYMTGVEVTDLSGLPDDFAGTRLPASRYAVFSHKEQVSTMRKTIDAIWKWLPESGLEASLLPLFFERYGEGFDPEKGMGDIEIWVPIKG